MLRIATVHPAIFLGRERDLGSLEADKRSCSSRATRSRTSPDSRPAGVMLAARWLPPEELAAMLAQPE